ncbi:MAG: hypothetical protein OEZ58_22330 [Gammaproteobacteria bacterium]|nr:hypothetical protein [Gammaproteobacteria bacterium]MDH5731728.1 hypothetical protein [Gammaproteobacteria bacterium]
MAMTNQKMESTNEDAAGLAAMSLFLALAIGELKLSTKDASGTVNTLTKTFMDMVRDVHEIKAVAEGLSDHAPDKATKAEILKTCDKFLDNVQAGTVGFQFYDKLSQRIQHTTLSLMNAKDIVEDENRFESADVWQSFREEMRKRYNMEQDRSLYTSLMQGLSISDAVKQAMQNNSDEDNTELF